MTARRYGLTVHEFPTDREIVTTREFRAPIELVFDALTKPEHVRHWFAPFTCVVTECEIDLRVGGAYHYVFVTEDGKECSFRGTFLEIERPHRVVDTWLFEGWPDAEAVETIELSQADDVTTLHMRLVFKDKTGRDHMTTNDGEEDSYNKLEDYLGTLLAAEAG